MKNIYQDILFGVAVADALGVPVEFNSRESLRSNPVADMRGFGSYDLPAGTFSDDSSLTFCLAEALTQEFSLQRIGDNFVQWYDNNFWTPHGDVFDIGVATLASIKRLKRGLDPVQAGATDVTENGNGSLMRILPLVIYIKHKTIEERFEITKQVSCITHGHIRSVIACFYYLEFARKILKGEDKFQIYKDLQVDIPGYLNSISIDSEEIKIFDRLLNKNIGESEEEDISSSGYVLHNLEASIWCLLTTGNYQEAVLKAVNLGGDTDTTGAVTGGLAGLLYGFDSIPKDWVQQIARKDDILELAERWQNKTEGLIA